MTGSSPGAVPLSRLAAATTTQGLPAAARRRQLHQLTSPSPTAAPRGGRARRQPAQTRGPSSCAVVRGRMTAAPAAVRSLQSAQDSSRAQTRVLESSEEGRRAAPLPCALLHQHCSVGKLLQRAVSEKWNVEQLGLTKESKRQLPFLCPLVLHSRSSNFLHRKRAVDGPRLILFERARTSSVQRSTVMRVPQFCQQHLLYFRDSPYLQTLGQLVPLLWPGR